MARTEETKLDLFLQWLQVNGAQFRGCNIKYCDSTKGFNIFSSNDSPKDGVLLVVPLDLAITPMRVLQDPLIGAECRAIFQEGQVDDMFLMILFLTVERLRKNSSWKPYLDMLPTTFGNPLWFTDDEMLELRGTILYRATELRKKDLISVYEDKVKGLVKKLLALDGVSESEVCFEDFLWVNSIFWSRALNLSLPHSYVFPQIQEDTETTCPVERSSEVTISHSGLSGESVNEIDGKDLRVMRMITKSMEKLPNRNKKKLSRRRRVFSLVLTFATMAVATWEVHVPKFPLFGALLLCF
ncbi:fructose-bisphosphate aldolase-lysine N-methyltransferase, chloroplastic-like [Hibiscus syriacus]|uniref:fructose-bisphosphate aldolase-lysine N-methyltransferase, chloroplastic-like n=1 Tax=Hibiscus syriacus TaxID=106335 RepID=UPI001921974E|nr:fructose-bisphosphate aldolase-lysine N-methyltransferase, chloroplastic-like [Hibiscus syriacus]